jgi:ketosteroid isomerase-like protein
MTSSIFTDDVLLRHFRAEQLLTTYTRLVDAKDVEGLAAIAHPNIVLTRRGGTQHGREAFVDLYRQFAASDVIDSQHMTTNVAVTEQAGGTLSVTSRFLAITTHPDGARMAWGRYDDDMVEHEGRLVFSAKRIEIVRVALAGEDMLAPVGAGSFGVVARAR